MVLESGKNNLFLKKAKNGFTLPEMIVVLTIFLLIIMTVYSIYILSRRAYLEGENTTEIIQNGRVILERLSREIRQARKIVTAFPEERINPSLEIKFQDGHIPLIVEEENVQQAIANTITLAPSASKEDDYYKDTFIKITKGTGLGQIRKISNYNGLTKIAEVEKDWDIIPDGSSGYNIDSSFYYIHYYRDNENNIWRKVSTYCFSENFLTCTAPEIYIPWNAIPPSSQSLLEVILEEPRVIGEYVTNLEFWGSRIINIALVLEKGGKSIELKTKIFGRNL